MENTPLQCDIGEKNNGHSKLYANTLNAAVFICVVLPLACLSVWAVYRSLGWRIAHDAPIMFYVAFLMDEFGMVPYRDIFDMNMPGTYWIHLMLGKLGGYNDAAYRAADIGVLSLLVLSLVCALRKLGWQAGLLGGCLFTLYYLSKGPDMSLQREYLALLPITLGLAATLWPAAWPMMLRAALASFFFALAATIKPHLLLAFPLVFVYLYFEADKLEVKASHLLKRLAMLVVSCALGALLPVGAVLGYLLYYGTLTQFLEGVSEYLPLYGSMTYNHQLLSPEKYAQYWWKNLLSLGGYRNEFYVALLTATMALLFSGADKRVRKQLILLVTMMLAYALYPGISGQFWRYHYLPLIYFFCVCMGLVMVRWRWGGLSQLCRLIVLAMLCVVFVQTFKPQEAFPSITKKPTVNKPKGGRVDAMTQYIRKNLKPGETIQILDWAAGGIAHAALQARAKSATSFIYDFHFYHHVSNPYIQNLRTRFLAEFDAAKPAMVIESTLNRPYFHGIDASNSFEAFYDRLEQGYELSLVKNEYRVWVSKAKLEKEKTTPKPRKKKNSTKKGK